MGIQCKSWPKEENEERLFPVAKETMFWKFENLHKIFYRILNQGLMRCFSELGRDWHNQAICRLKDTEHSYFEDNSKGVNKAIEGLRTISSI